MYENFNLQVVAPARQIGRLGDVARQIDGPVVRQARFVTQAEPMQQIGARRVIGVIGGQRVLEAVDGRQCYLRPLQLGNRDGPVERDVEIGSLDDPESGQVLLGLHEGPVDDERLATSVVDDGGSVGPAEAGGEYPVAPGAEPVVEYIDRRGLGGGGEPG